MKTDIYRFHKKARESRGIFNLFWFMVAVLYTQYAVAVGKMK